MADDPIDFKRRQWAESVYCKNLHHQQSWRFGVTEHNGEFILHLLKGQNNILTVDLVTLWKAII